MRVTIACIIAFLGSAMVTPGLAQSQVVQRARLDASDGADGDRFGSCVRVTQRFAFVGAPGADVGGLSDAGAVYVFTRDERVWVESAKLTATNPEAGAQFGFAIDVDENQLVIGAPGYPTTVNLFGSTFEAPNGAFYVFEQSGASWVESWLEPRAMRVSGMTTGSFGHGVAIHAGELIIADERSTGTGSNDAWLTVYQFQNGSWIQSLQHQIVNGSRTGRSLDLEGGVCVASGLSSAYLLTSRASSLSDLTQIPLPPGADLSGFGRSVTIDGPSATYFIGQGNDGIDESRRIYEYSATPPGSVTPTAELLASGTTITSVGSSLNAVALDLGGDDLWMGQPGYDNGAAADAGSLVRFTRANGSWTEVDRIFPSDSAARRNFGLAVHSASGFVIASALPPQGGPALTEAAYIYEVAPGEEFCFGDGADPGGCNDCPCSNEAPLGTMGGCSNSASRSARLLLLGTASASDDSLRVELHDAIPNSFALLLSADNALPQNGPCPVGSGILSAQVPLGGLRCIGSNLLRHGVRSTDGSGKAGTISQPGWGNTLSGGTSLVSEFGWPSATNRMLQIFYRDLPGSGCGTGLNSTNAVSVNLAP